MPLFGSKKATLEVQLAAALSRIPELESQLATVTSERDQARTERDAAVAAQSGDVASLTEQLNTARTELLAAQTATTAATERLTSLVTAIRKPLELTDDEAEAVNKGESASISAAVKRLATREAVNIAAGQGGMPVPTAAKPVGKPDDNPAEAAFAAAREEKDPVRRGEKFAEAERLLKKKAHGRN